MATDWRLSIDTGGTFTDLVVDTTTETRLYKSPTTPEDPVLGILNVLQSAADDLAMDRRELLGKVSHLVHGTTRAVNAIVSGGTAKTALLVTEGHPDILLFREGGRIEPFNHTVPFPRPYVPRALTFEVPERVGADGEVVAPLDVAALDAALREAASRDVEAIAVSFLWAIANPGHELAAGERIEHLLPGVPYTLGHQINPSLREYRRTIATAIDASLKPLMASYLASLEERLRDAGFAGRLLVVTSQGGAMDARAMAGAPIHAINSGPAMAPVAGLMLAQDERGDGDIIVADTGGTTYDVSLIRGDAIPRTRETWLGEPYRGDMTGFPSVDVKSIGAGGGSIASVDSAGLLRVGPASVGADPGPACYGRGGTQATVTDAALLLGYLDPDRFAAGTMRLDATRAGDAIAQHVGGPLGLDVNRAALAVMELATEQMVGAIQRITLDQGIDPADAILIGGGGAAGLNSVAIMRRLGCRAVVIPRTGAALSAAGGLMSELSAEFAEVSVTSSERFDRAAANAVLLALQDQARGFARDMGAEPEETRMDWVVEARYAHQAWEIDVPLARPAIEDESAAEALRQDFDAAHKKLFGIDDPRSEVEFVAWRVRVGCRLAAPDLPPMKHQAEQSFRDRRTVVFAGGVDTETPVLRGSDLTGDGTVFAGPAIIEQPFTTVVMDPGCTAYSRADGAIVITP